MTTSTRTHTPREPAVGEYDDVLIKDISGVIPEALRGTLYRNGPARWEAGGFYARHLFDGDGMVSKFVLDGGTLRYRNRYVRTPKFRAEEKDRGRRVRVMGTNIPGGPLRNIGRIPADRANTNAVYHGDHLLALSDDGRPWDIDPDTLKTLGRYSFGQPMLSTFSPHPKIDPRTGEMFNFGLTVPPVPRPGALAALRCYRTDASHRLHTIATVPLPRVYINHDFGLTERYLVFVIDPLHVKHPIRMGLGLLDANAATVHEADLGSLVLLVPRDGGPVRRFAIPAIAKAHVNNAFDDGGDVVIDVVRYDDWNALSAMLCNFRDHEAFKGGVLSRIRLTTADHAVVEDICTLYSEFPMHDWRRTGAPYRFSYLVYGDGLHRAGIAKVDNDTGQQWHHDLVPDDFPGEPIFVPRSPDAAEDDGWLLVINYLAAEHRTALVILDARDVEAEPVAVARLPHHFMPGFHGMFTPDLRLAADRPAQNPMR